MRTLRARTFAARHFRARTLHGEMGAVSTHGGYGGIPASPRPSHRRYGPAPRSEEQDFFELATLLALALEADDLA